MSLSGSDFRVAEIAPRIGRPGVAGDDFGAGAEAAAAEIEVAAVPAASVEETEPFLETGHDRVARVLPDLGKGPVEDVAEAAVDRELIGVDVAVEVDV